MIYVLDTNIIRKIWFHLPRKGQMFEKIWKAFEDCIDKGEIVSVDEAYNELASQFSKDNEARKWLNERKRMFLNPNNEESQIIKTLFEKNKYRESVHRKNILDNRPSADVYLVAKAKCLGATIVTAEAYKDNSAQLPNLCEEIGIGVTSYDDFMEYVQSMVI